MPSDLPDTLLDHPALAGHTIYVRRGPRWETYVVRDGGLAPQACVGSPAPAASWRPTVGA
jgi:hypothetical protein